MFILLVATDNVYNYKEFDQIINLKLKCSKNFTLPKNGIYNNFKNYFFTNKVKDIKNLKFTDLKIVASIGDSITAGFGVNNIRGGLQEYIGKNWATGFDFDAYSLANFIQFYSPNLVGGSVGKHLISISNKCNIPYKHIPFFDKFNSAQSSARACNGKQQVKWLIDQMQNTKYNVSYNHDWKFISVLMGFNDVCQYCKTNNYLENFTINYRQLLNKLYEIPNAYINIVQLFNGKEMELLRYKKTNLYCKHINILVGTYECPCLNNIVKTENYDFLQKLFDEYNTIIKNLVKEFNLLAITENRHDWYSKIVDVSIDFSLYDFSNIDCFHLSLSGQKKLALAVWNKLTANIDNYDTFYCLNNQTLKLIK